MRCPKCGHDLPGVVDRCPGCDVALTWVDDGEDPEHAPDALVAVLQTSDATLMPVVRSLLEAEGIRCYVGNDVLQDLLAGGRIGMGYNIAVGSMVLRVAASDAEAARALIAHHTRSNPRAEPPGR